MKLPTIIIPMEIPWRGWYRKLRQDFRGLQDVLRLTGHRDFDAWGLCLFCRVPHRLKDIPDPSGVLSGYNSDPWVVEFPDGRRIRQPKLPRPIQGPYFVICPSCADVIDPIRDGAQPTVGFVSCEICDVDILVPSWKHLRHHWEVILYVFPSLEAEIPTVQRPAFLCLSCQYKLWSWRQDGDSLPYVTERKAVADLWGLPWPGYISFRFDHPPAPFPVVYDPGMAREA